MAIRTEKSSAQIEREIDEALARPVKGRAKAKARRDPRLHELFYLSADVPGGKNATHIDHFGTLQEALDALARMQNGSITYGTAKTGPEFMMVWASPEMSDMLYWTDGDLSAKPRDQDETKRIRRFASKKKDDANAMAYFNKLFAKRIDSLKKSGYRWRFV